MTLISIIFFFSGLSALVYQLLWMRHLGFIFGNTIYAGTTVLTAFMTGLALGAYIFGRYAERIKNPLRCFAFLEWGIAAYALILPFLFQGLQHVYRFAYRNISDELIFLTPLRFILAFLLLILPTLLMGGTLPVLIRALAHRQEDFGHRLAWLYGINTLGAVAGVLSSGFFLIPAVGLTNTNIIAASTDLIAGFGAWLLAYKATVPQPTPEPKRPKYPFRDMPALSRYAVITATLCGFISLALEVIWFRALILVFGSTTYSFTVMLAVFLLGISLGSLLISPFLDKIKNLMLLLAGTMACIGLYTFGSLYLFDRSPEFLLNHLLGYGFTWASMTRARFLISLSHLAIPALGFGIIFTTATRAVRREENSSSGVTGTLFALDSIGAMLGAFAGGFILLPNLGIEKSLLLLGIVIGFFGLITLVLQKANQPLRAVAIVTASCTVILLALTPPHWNQELLSAGAFFSPFNFVRDERVTLRETIMADRLLHYEEALSSTVSVHLGIHEQKYFCVDGKTEADQSSRGMVVQRMIGHLPMLFHPDPKSVVNVGLGAGVSFGALGCYPVKHLEVVEIEPAVKTAARFWGNLNHNILDNPKAIVTVNDGRNHLFSTTNRYDVISADPFEPVVGGAAHLFTANYFQLAQDRLAPGGIMCQWVPMYEMSADDYLMIVRTFSHVFPQSALFFTGTDTLLLGFKEDMILDPDVLRRNFEIPTVRASLEEVGFLSPETILGMFVADLRDQVHFLEGLINTDNNPYIEFSVPKKSMIYTPDENQSALLSVFTPIPEEWLIGLDNETAERLQTEHEAVRLMLEAGVLRAQNQQDQAYQKLAEAHTIAPQNPVVKNELVAMLEVSANGLRAMGQRDQAAQQFQTILRLEPDHFWALHNLVELGMIAERHDFATQVLERGLTAYPDSPLMQALQGKFLFTAGQREDGLALMLQAAHAHPDYLPLWEDLHNLASLSGHFDLRTQAQQNITRIRRYLRR